MSSVVVHDSSVLIDLAAGGLLEAYLELDFKTITTDFIVHEVSKDSRPIATWLRTHAEIQSYTNRELGELMASKALHHPGLSLPDTSVLYLAKERKALLLTNDQRLRKTALGMEVEAHGVIMIMDRLHQHEKLPGHALSASLRKMLEAGARLPANVCEKCFKEWSEE